MDEYNSEQMAILSRHGVNSPAALPDAIDRLRFANAAYTAPTMQTTPSLPADDGQPLRLSADLIDSLPANRKLDLARQMDYLATERVERAYGRGSMDDRAYRDGLMQLRAYLDGRSAAVVQTIMDWIDLAKRNSAA